MANENEKYNGWTNYETWNVKLWLDNEQSTYEMQREMLHDAKNTPKVDVWTKEETVKFTLADMLKEYIEENNPLNDDASLYSDILSANLQQVNWNEIAEVIIQDFSEN